ncbi:MAG: trimeric intracellular cation channel family protein [Spirochaetaceae bacterium]|nr:MAG: trimeric intracellular cation channel family protein [Spirochaetaceae bacterium]
MMDTVFPTVEAIGIIAFGVSGYLVARRRCLDAYGTVVLALVTALGGGAIRDLVLGITPPVNLLSPAAILLAAGPAIVLSLRPIDRALRLPAVGRILPLSHALVTADALGLAAFTVSGVSAAALVSESVTLALFCGVLTATGGGMLRDLLAGAVPAVLRREIYAVASLVGALAMVVVAPLGSIASVLTGMGVTFLIRVGTYALRINLPLPQGCGEKGTET